MRGHRRCLGLRLKARSERAVTRVAAILIRLYGLQS